LDGTGAIGSDGLNRAVAYEPTQVVQESRSRTGSTPRPSPACHWSRPGQGHAALRAVAWRHPWPALRPTAKRLV